MGMASSVYYSAEQVRQLNVDGRPSPRHEVVHGELLVTPAPSLRHQRIALGLYRALASFLDAHPTLGLEALAAPVDVMLAHDSMVEPDVVVFHREESARHEGRYLSDLVLAVEVFSPSSTRQDRFAKRPLYQAKGITCWLVDPERSLLEVWYPGATFPLTETTELRWHPDGAEAELVVDLTALFAAQ